MQFKWRPVMLNTKLATTSFPKLVQVGSVVRHKIKKVSMTVRHMQPGINAMGCATIFVYTNWFEIQGEIRIGEFMEYVGYMDVFALDELEFPT